MARPRSFEPDAVLDAARDLFWARGYEGASLDDITAATGVNKPSLSAAFGDKASLFLAVLERYHAMLIAHARHSLGDPQGSARDAISKWFTGFLPVCSGAGGKRGCLSVNSGVAPPGDAAVQSIAAYNRQIEALLRKAIERGKAAGEFPREYDAKGVARALLAALTGLMLLARQTPGATETRAAMSHVLAILYPAVK